MRTILISEICNEKPNSSALGAFNDAVSAQVLSVNIDTVTQKQIDLQKTLNRAFRDKVAEKAAYLADELRANGVTLYTGVAATAFQNEGKTIVLENGVTLESDLTIMSVG